MPTAGRDETAAERLDRNWSEILQELRVIQTGTQVLTGFLLTLVFQQRFVSLDAYQVATYLTLVVIAGIATCLALAPVALHRTLFRHQARGQLVLIANRLLKATLLAVGITLAGNVMLVFDIVVGRPEGIVAGALSFLLVVLAWIALPFGVRRKIPPV
jgi:hypothetical protein